MNELKYAVIVLFFESICVERVGELRSPIGQPTTVYRCCKIILTKNEINHNLKKTTQTNIAQTHKQI